MCLYTDLDCFDGCFFFHRNGKGGEGGGLVFPIISARKKQNKQTNKQTNKTTFFRVAFGDLAWCQTQWNTFFSAELICACAHASKFSEFGLCPKFAIKEREKKNHEMVYRPLPIWQISVFRCHVVNKKPYILQLHLRASWCCLSIHRCFIQA